MASNISGSRKDKSNSQIAKVLGCCEEAVRKHLEHLYQKL
ncbi:helix-turn-helix transcriptional regulator [Microcoleus sp. Aus8_D3]